MNVQQSYLVPLLVGTLWFKNIVTADSNRNYTKLLHGLLKDYSSQARPDIDKPTEIKIGITVDNIISVRDEDMSFTMKLFLRQSWIDPRFTFEEARHKGLPINKSFQYMNLPAQYLFIPDTYFR